MYIALHEFRVHLKSFLSFGAMLLSLLLLVFCQLLQSQPEAGSLQRRGDDSTQCDPHLPELAVFYSDCEVMLQQTRRILADPQAFTTSYVPLPEPLNRWHALPFPSTTTVWRLSLKRHSCAFDIGFDYTEPLPRSRYELSLLVASEIYKTCLVHLKRAGGSLNANAWFEGHQLTHHATLYELHGDDIVPLKYETVADGEVSFVEADDERAPLLRSGASSSLHAPHLPKHPTASESTPNWDYEHLIDIPPEDDGDPLAEPDTPGPPNPTHSMARPSDTPLADNTDRGRLIANAPGTNATSCGSFVRRICCWNHDRLWDRLNPTQLLGGGVISTLVGCLATYSLTKHAATAQVAELCAEAVNAGFQLGSCAS